MIIGKKGSVSESGTTIVYDGENENIYELNIPNYPEGTTIIKNEKGQWEAVTTGLAKEVANRLHQMEEFYYMTKNFLPYNDYCYIINKFCTNCASKFKQNPFYLSDVFRENSERPICDIPTIDKNIILSTFEARLNEIKCIIKYCLLKNENNGHTWITYNELETWVCQILKEDRHPLFMGTVAHYLRYYNEEFYFEDLENIEESKVALYATYYRELSIYREICFANSLNTPFPLYNPQVEEDLSIEQNKAVKDLILKGGHISILTGGPGTGKTTIIRYMVSKILNQYSDTRICLLAPTGKAARRISEVFENSEMEISTIHKFLGYGHPLSAREIKRITSVDICIVDEASMIDLELFEKLLSMLDMDRTKLILVGDVDQLPSIGAGNVLCDLINLGLHTERLTANYRSNGSIINNAHRINSGDFFLEEDDNFIIEEGNEDTLEYLSAISKENDIIITPYRVNTRLGSTQNINKLVQSKKFTSYSYNGFHVGDTVIMVNTNYKQGYFNGEVGVILSYTPNGDYYVGFGDRELLVKDVNDMDLGYAITVYKSQGSEYSQVDMCVPNYSDFITRRMLYTAVTRAKGKIKIRVSSLEILRKIILNNKEEHRRTFLSEFKKIT